MAKEKWGNTPLHYAVRWEHLKVTQYLIAHGVGVNEKGLSDKTPLHDAAVCGNLELVQLLVDMGQF
jgi:ankyrin repeat protein